MGEEPLTRSPVDQPETEEKGAEIFVNNSFQLPFKNSLNKLSSILEMKKICTRNQRKRNAITSYNLRPSRVFTEKSAKGKHKEAMPF
jgi:hypothetical protein